MPVLATLQKDLKLELPSKFDGSGHGGNADRDGGSPRQACCRSWTM